MLIPSWRAHLHPLVDDDAQASAGDEAHTLAFGPAVGVPRVLYIWNFLCGISSILYVLTGGNCAVFFQFT